jgi:hypothetical protein
LWSAITETTLDTTAEVNDGNEDILRSHWTQGIVGRGKQRPAELCGTVHYEQIHDELNFRGTTQMLPHKTANSNIYKRCGNLVSKNGFEESSQEQLENWIFLSLNVGVQISPHESNLRADRR